MTDLLGALPGNDTGDVRSVADRVHGVLVGLPLLARIGPVGWSSQPSFFPPSYVVSTGLLAKLTVVADKVITAGNLATRSEAASKLWEGGNEVESAIHRRIHANTRRQKGEKKKKKKRTHSWMGILNACVHDADLDALAQNPLLVKLVDARHPVDRVVRRARVVAERLARHHGRQLHARRVPRLDDGRERLERVRVLAVRLDGDAPEHGRVEHLEHPAAGARLELPDHGVLVGRLRGEL